MRRKNLLVVGALALTIGGAAFAHVRLRVSSSGPELAWPTPGSISLVISSTGPDDLPARGHETAVRNAIDAWNAASGQTARIVENKDPAQRARTDWQSHDLQLLFFDENNSTGYFPGSTGAVAVTPIWFLLNGTILDADVIFNGRDFQFTTSGESGRFDLQDIATHELGHLLGLDHSGWAGSTMYPFVDPAIVLHRSLSWDEVTGLRDAYPAENHARLSGRVRRAFDSSPVAGAHIVVRDNGGRTRASTLSDPDGSFELRGLGGGAYQLYATPFDQPVSGTNLAQGWLIHTDFQTTSFAPVGIVPGQALEIGDHFVDGDVALSLGLSSDRLPLRGIAGTSAGFALGGQGLVPGSTLQPSDPSVTLNVSFWGATNVQFQMSIPADAAPGHFDLIVTGPGGERSALVAAVEVTPPDPVVDLVTPAEGAVEGETQLTIKGSGFRPGARVVMGGEIYVDGEPGGAEVIDSATIRLKTRESLPGTTDVVVIDCTGVEGRKSAGYRFVAFPAITSVFPAAGSAAGGTRVIIRGRHFAPGVTVRIGGVLQTLDFSEGFDSKRLVIAATAPGPAGGSTVLELRNPEGEEALASFDYVDAVDPVLGAVEPGFAGAGGGTELTLTGSGFGPDAQVVFGADPETGAGGLSAAAVTFVDATTLRVTTPAHPAGLASVMVRSADTGQAALLPSALHFQGKSGGGGCSALPIDGGLRDPLDAVLGGLGLLMLALGMRAVGARPRPATVRAG